MASAMKKLKLLHTINTSPTSTHREQHHLQQEAASPVLPPLSSFIHNKLPATPPSSNLSLADKPTRQHRSRIPVPVYYQQNLTPPVTPTGSSVSNSTPPSPQQNLRPRPSPPSSSEPAESYRERHKYYADMLRSARQACTSFVTPHRQALQQHQQQQQQLQQLQQQQQQQLQLQQQQLQQRQQQQLQQQLQQQQQRQQQQSRSLFPLLSDLATPNSQQQQKRHPVLPGGAFLLQTQGDPHAAICIPNSLGHPSQQQTAQFSLPNKLPATESSNASPSTPLRSTKRKQSRLTQKAVELICLIQDSRMVRWNRVQSYVKDQRKLVESEQCLTGSQNEGTFEDIYAEINEKNRCMDELEKLPEAQERSLWSGGSAGTNGVDEFVWDDDEEGFQGDADMLDSDDRGNRERERMKREYQRQQLQMQQQALMIKMQKMQRDHAEAIEGRLMKQEGAKPAATHRYRRKNQDSVNTPPQTPTSSGVSSRHQQPTPATPPQLKAYTTSFFKPSSRPEPQQQQQLPQQRSLRQEYHQRPGTAGSGSRSPGYKRQSLGRGVTGKTAGSPGSIDGAIFRMDGEAMDLDQNTPAPTSSRASQYQQYPRATPSYSSPTFAFLGKSRSAAVAGGTGRSPTAAATPATPTPSAMDKGLREYYLEAFRRHAPEGDAAEQDGRRRRRRVPTIPTGSYY